MKEIGLGVYHVTKTRYYNEKLAKDNKKIDNLNVTELTRYKKRVEAYREFEFKMNEKIEKAMEYFLNSDSPEVHKMLERAEKEFTSQTIVYAD